MLLKILTVKLATHNNAFFLKPVSFQWKNPYLLFKNPDFLLKNPDFLLKHGEFITKQHIGGALAAAVWDSMACHAVMKSAELRAIGVVTGVEVFNEVLDKFCPLFEANPSTLSGKK